MSTNQTTLDTFFGFSPSGTPGSEEYEEILADLPMDQVEESIGKSQANLKIPIVAGLLLKAIATTLEIPLWDVIEKAWTEGHLFEKYFDPENYKPDELISISLKDHEISSEHHPSIDLVLNGKKIASIPLLLAVRLKLEGAILNIRGGQVLDIQAGYIQGSADLGLLGQTLFTRETEKMELPGTIRFSQGQENAGVNPG